MATCSQKPAYRRMRFWVWVGIVSLTIVIVTGASGITRMGFAGADDLDPCARAGMEYDWAGATMADDDRWPFSNQCNATENTVPWSLNALFICGLISLGLAVPAIFACAAADDWVDRRTDSRE